MVFMDDSYLLWQILPYNAIFCQQGKPVKLSPPPNKSSCGSTRCSALAVPDVKQLGSPSAITPTLPSAELVTVRCAPLAKPRCANAPCVHPHRAYQRKATFENALDATVPAASRQTEPKRSDALDKALGESARSARWHQSWKALAAHFWKCVEASACGDICDGALRLKRTDERVTIDCSAGKLACVCSSFIANCDLRAQSVACEQITVASACLRAPLMKRVRFTSTLLRKSALQA